MKILRTLFIILSLCSTLVVSQGALAASYPSLFQSACGAQGGAGGSSAACKAPTEPVSGSGGILAKATGIVSLLAGVASIIMIMIAALFFVTADGDPSKAATARRALLGVVIGILIVLLSQAILRFVLTKVS